MTLHPKVKAWWNDQPGNKKRMYLILLIVISLMATSVIFKKERSKVKDPRVVKTTVALDDVTVVSAPRRTETREDEKAQIRALQLKFEGKDKETKELQMKLDQQEQENKKFAEESLKNQSSEFAKQVSQLADEIKVLRSGVNNPVNDSGLPVLNTGGVNAPGLPKKKTEKIDPPLPALPSSPSAIFENEATQKTEITKPKLRVIGEKAVVKNLTEIADNSSKNLSESGSANSNGAAVIGKQGQHFIPAGSIIDGVLINGMDAPTDATAQKQPVPALVRVKQEAILPNRYSADVRECFILISGFGSLSDERAKFRSETLSCVRKDGGVIETKIDAYVVSAEDGKVGLRGRLVTKQGAVLARSLLAGFASGFSSAMSPQSVNTLATGSIGGSTQFQKPDVADAAQQGAHSGVGKALDNLSQYYLDTAKQLHPVLEIDAGRKVSIILVRGTMLALAAASSRRDH